ncbi:MAG TPA: hypothetical protein VGO27_15570 [Candidatus Acidoferrum sp.]|nr:hypothetical protein [Candidatus Acidoferrum sp.]
MITASEARYVAYLYIFWARIGESALQSGAQFRRAKQVATHVGANTQIGFGRRS